MLAGRSSWRMLDPNISQRCETTQRRTTIYHNSASGCQMLLDWSDSVVWHALDLQLVPTKAQRFLGIMRNLYEIYESIESCSRLQTSWLFVPKRRKMCCYGVVSDVLPSKEVQCLGLSPWSSAKSSFIVIPSISKVVCSCLLWKTMKKTRVWSRISGALPKQAAAKRKVKKAPRLQDRMTGLVGKFCKIKSWLQEM